MTRKGALERGVVIHHPSFCIQKTTRWASGSKEPVAMREKEKLPLL